MTEGKVVEASIVVTGIVEEEDGQYVAYCRELGTSTFGDSLESAFKNLEDAIGVHLDGLEKVGELAHFLRERNINIVIDRRDDDLLLPVPLDKPLKRYQHPVPLSATA